MENIACVQIFQMSSCPSLGIILHVFCLYLCECRLKPKRFNLPFLSVNQVNNSSWRTLNVEKVQKITLC